MSEQELLPCPFCGDKAELVEFDTMPNEFWGGYIYCLSCEASGGRDHDYKQDAIDDWNTRHPAADELEKVKVETLNEVISMIEALEGYDFRALVHVIKLKMEELRQSKLQGENSE